MNVVRMNDGRFLNRDNGMILSSKEVEKELIVKDFTSDTCQGETTKKLSKIKKTKKVVDDNGEDNTSIEETTTAD